MCLGFEAPHQLLPKSPTFILDTLDMLDTLGMFLLETSSTCLAGTFQASGFGGEGRTMANLLFSCTEFIVLFGGFFLDSAFAGLWP